MIRCETDKLNVLGPPPGPAYDDFGRRRWLALFDGESVTQADVDTFINRQANIDPDIWVIDIDDSSGAGLLDPETIE